MCRACVRTAEPDQPDPKLAHMSGPPQSYYVELGSFDEGEKQILMEYISAPAKYLGPIMVSALTGMGQAGESEGGRC